MNHPPIVTSLHSQPSRSATSPCRLGGWARWSTLVILLMTAAWLRAAEPGPWLTLFDGQGWGGWEHPAHLDGVWKIADGVIRLSTNEPPRVKGRDYNLSTKRRDFRDFELRLDWRLTGPVVMRPHPVLTDEGLYQTNAAGATVSQDHPRWGDSGVYLRGARAAQVNIWCLPCGSGEVGTKFKDLAASRDERLKTMPRVRADKGPGEWNTFLITMRGDRVDVVLNGVQVITGARVKDIPATGPITLQNHRDAVEFRHIAVRELK